MLRPIRDQILEYGRVRRGWLGVAIQDLTPEIARSLGLKDIDGVLISDVLEDGPASKANLEAGDIVLSVNGKLTKSAAQLRNHVALIKPGTKAKLRVQREGSLRTISVVLEEKKDDEAIASAAEKSVKLLSGLTLHKLDDELRSRLQVPLRVQGVAVTQVEPGSPAGRSGLEAGDIITAVDRKKVKTIPQLRKVVPRNAQEILLRVYKRGLFTFIVLRR